MALPSPDRQLLQSSATGNETSASGVLVKGSFWFVYERFQSLSLREYGGAHFPGIRESVPIFHLSQALDSGLNILTDRFWLWEITSASELNLIEVEPFSSQSPVIHSVTNIESGVENIRVDIIDGQPVRAFILKTGTPNEQWLYVFNDVKSGVPDITTPLEWTATRLDNYDSAVDSTTLTSFQLNYSDTASPPNIYTVSYTLSIPQIISGSQAGPIVNISWDTITGGEDYRLQRTINDPTFNPANITEVYYEPNTSTTDFVPSYDTTYYYRVKLVMPSLAIESDWSTIVSVSITGVPIIYIHNVTELQYVGTVWPSDASYEVANDIDATATLGWNGGAGFIPNPAFTGDFNGAGYTISNLYINDATSTPSEYRAIFDNVTSATFYDLTVADATIGNSNAAILVGESAGTSTFTNCHVSGNITGDGGGLVYACNNNTINIINCSSDVTFTGGTQHGGLAKYLYGTSTISNCSVDLTIINGGGNWGGMMQYVSGSTMTDCTCVVDVEVNGSSGNNGGFTGSTYDSDFTNCHTSGNVTCNGSVNTHGGFSAYTSGSTIHNCSADIDYTGTAYSYQIAGFIGYNSSNTISDCTSSGLINISGVSGTSNTGGFAGYSGGHLSNCSSTVDITINTSNSSSYIGGFAGYFSPSGSGVTNNCYSTGNIYVSPQAYSAGGFAGYLYSSSTPYALTNCFSAGNVIGDASNYVSGYENQNFGGFAGYCYGRLFRCHSVGNISGGRNVGGFAGYNGNDLEQCFSLGNVENYYVNGGGLTGHTFGDLLDCYAQGDIVFKGTSGGYVGGLAGEFSGITATNCYSKGSVSEDNVGASTPGGLVARESSATTTSSYWDIQTSGQPTSAAGTGATTAAMLTQSTYVGWDFTNIWRMKAGVVYPQFLLADFSADVLSGLTPLTVTFTNDTTGWPDENAAILVRDWDFGDGSLHSSEYNPVHIYTTAGNFTVTLVETRNYVDTTEVRVNYIQVAGYVPPFPITGPRYWISSVDSTWADTDNWSNTSGGPGGYSIPAIQNVVIFDSGGSGNCDIDATVDVQGLALNGYSGIVRQNGYSMQMDTTGGLFWTGDFSGSGADIRVQGNLYIGGVANFLSTDQTLSCDSTFLYYSTGTYNHNNGVISLDSSGCMLDASGMVTSALQFNTTQARMGESCYVERLLVLNQGSARHLNSGRNIFVQGDVSCHAEYDQWTDYNNLSILLDSTTRQSITNEIGCIVPTLFVNKDTTEQVICYGGSPLRIKGDFALYDGTFNTNGLDVQVGL